VKYLLQQETGVMYEEKFMIKSSPSYSHFFLSYEQLKPVEDKENIIPVGTVEFVKKYCEQNNIILPENISYPEQLMGFFGRNIWSGVYGDVKPDQFCKPKSTKVFTGGIKKDIEEPVKHSEHVWISDPVNITSEWRVYVLNKQILGYSRYDTGDNEEQPDLELAKKMVECYNGSPVGYCLDVGVVDGKTILVEANDGWSLGYYRWGDMCPDDYIKLISARWLEIVRNK
jgi:hypothetical protein